MAALVTNKTQADDLGAGTMTLAAVGGSEAAFLAGANTTRFGIDEDGSNRCQRLETAGGSTTSGDHLSAWISFGGSSYDISGADQAFIVHLQQGNLSFNTYTSASDSLRLILFSGGGTTNYARWHFNIQDYINGDWWLLSMSGTPDATGGTFDDTDVTGWGVAVETNQTGGNFGVDIVVDQLVYTNGEVVFEDTGAAATLTFESYRDQVYALSGNSFHSDANLEAKPAYVFGHGILIESDDFSDSNYVLIFKDNAGGFTVSTTDYYSLSITPDNATATMTFTNGLHSYDSGTYDLTINSATLTSGTITMTNCTFLKTRNVTIGGNAQASINATITSPTGTVDISDVDADLTITGTSSAIQWTADLAANSRIITDSDIDITFAETDLSDITITLTASNTVTVSPTTGSGTYDLSALTTTGTVTLDNATANNTTIVLASGVTNTVASPTTGGGSITVSQPTTTFTINTNVSALIRIYTTNTQTILDSTTGTSLAFTHTGQTIDYTIEAAGYIPQRFTSETLSGTSSVTINLVADPIYVSGHGLTFTTDYSYDASTRVMTIVANQEGRNLYSALIDDFQTETAFRNCPFPLVAIGPDRIDFKAVGYYNSATTVGATIDSGDIQFWKGAGMEWEHDTTGNPTKKFYSIKSSNTLQASSVVGYTQVLAGTPVEATLVSDQVNQVIQYFEDTNGDGTPDYNYTGHLLFKGFLTGYYQARWDVINDGGVSSLESYEYNIALTQTAIAGATGNQSITITTLTDHTGAPITVGGRSFDYELVDPGTNSAENLLAQHNYNVYNAVNTSISGSLYTSYQAFDLPDLVVEAGSNYETERGYFEGDGLVTDLSGVYLSRSAADHPDISRFQSNDGTYYTPAVTANATGTNLPDDVGGDTNLQIYNLTAASASAWQASTAYTEGDLVLRSTGVGSESTAGLFFRCISAGTSGGTEPTWVTTTAGVFGTAGSQTTDNTVTWECFALLLYDADPASTGWSDTYIDGEEFASGETARIRFAHLNGATSFEYGQTTAAVTTSGFSFDGSLFIAADSVYATNAVDGSSTAVQNIFTADYANDEIDLDADTDFAATQFFAFYCYELTTSQGMHQFWNGVTAIDAGNYRINATIVDMYFDETAGFVKQTDSARIYRDDGVRPAIDPTTGGNGLEINWRNPVYLQETGVSGLTASESTQLALIATVDNNVDLLIQDQGLDISNPKTITENTEGTSYDETFSTVTKEIRRSGSSTTITRTS